MTATEGSRAWLKGPCAVQAKSTGKLIQSLAVFKACSIKPLVENADAIIRASRRVAAPLVDSVIKQTMFRHFCGGECVESIQPTLKVHSGLLKCRISDGRMPALLPLAIAAGHALDDRSKAASDSFTHLHVAFTYSLRAQRQARRDAAQLAWRIAVSVSM